MTPTARQAQPATEAYYREVLTALNEAGVSFLVGGACALQHYTGLIRDTKDLDLFLRRRDLERTFEVLSAIGCHTGMAFPFWLGKALRDGDLVDLIFSSGNGVAAVDEEWFQHATRGHVFGNEVQFCPVEEMIWQKAFIMERERFDGADVAHLIRARAGQMSWPRLLCRFGHHWPVLFVHCVLFGFIYPGDRSIPAEVMTELTQRLARQTGEPPSESGLCRGTLLSRAQYLVDVEHWGMHDARLSQEASMTAADLEGWTAEVPDKVRPSFEPPRS